MKYRHLGRTGVKVHPLCLGCMNFGMMSDQSTTDDVVAAALAAGVNFFDVADIYGGPHGKAEAMLGVALGEPQGRQCMGIIRR